MAFEAAFCKRFGDLETGLCIERQGAGVIGLDTQHNTAVPSSVAGLDEGGQQLLAQSLSARGGGDGDVGQFDLAGLKDVGVRGRKHRLGKLDEDARTSKGQPQHLAGEPGERPAQAGVDLVRMRGADGPAQHFTIWGDGAKAYYG